MLAAVRARRKSSAKSVSESPQTRASGMPGTTATSSSSAVKDARSCASFGPSLAAGPFFSTFFSTFFLTSASFSACAGVDAQDGELRPLRQARPDRFPVRQQLGWTRHVRGSSRGDVFVTLLNLIEQVGRVRVDLVALRHDDARGAGPGQVVEDGSPAIVLEDVAQRDPDEVRGGEDQEGGE